MDGERMDAEDRAATARRQVRKGVKAFARREIAPRADLREHETVPAELWRAIGEAGLAGIGLPREYGGDGGDMRTLVTAAEAMAEAGGNLGMVTSWLGRQLISRLHILGFGDRRQRDAYLPALAAGRMTPCLAISEPGAGAHPKRLTTSATRDGDVFVLNGEKAYLTNGPIADIFLILAITGVENGRKRFSVLITPRDAPGLELTDGVKIDYLRPSPHCGLRLHDVRVPVDSLLGPEGDAFEAISLPMRRTEDAVFAASKAGAMRHLLVRLAHESKNLPLGDDDFAELGKLSAATTGLGALAFHAAELLDIAPVAQADDVSSIAAAARDWAGGLNERTQALIDRCGLKPSPGLAAECRDFEKSLGIARAAHAIQASRRGKALMETTEANTL